MSALNNELLKCVKYPVSRSSLDCQESSFSSPQHGDNKAKEKLVSDEGIDPVELNYSCTNSVVDHVGAIAQSCHVQLLIGK